MTATADNPDDAVAEAAKAEMAAQAAARAVRAEALVKGTVPSANRH